MSYILCAETCSVCSVCSPTNERGHSTGSSVYRSLDVLKEDKTYSGWSHKDRCDLLHGQQTADIIRFDYALIINNNNNNNNNAFLAPHVMSRSIKQWNARQASRSCRWQSNPGRRIIFRSVFFCFGFIHSLILERQSSSEGEVWPVN